MSWLHREGQALAERLGCPVTCRADADSAAGIPDFASSTPVSPTNCWFFTDLFTQVMQSDDVLELTGDPGFSPMMARAV
ncbi:MAG: hypothetical protein N2508_07670 [Anaerolineae bacterium]|nr:hypothetical protein [Anaerolineae bacterium]